MRLINYLKGLGLAVLSASLISCGGGGSCAPGSNGSNPAPTPGTLSLTLTAPNQYPAGVAVTAYLTMTNTSNVNANNLFYAVPAGTNYTGATITVSNDSTQPCKNIPAGQSCTFPAQISANSHPGSFTVTATPGVASSASSTTGSFFGKLKSVIGLKAETLSLTANIGLTDVVANDQSGANGITFFYSHTIPASESGPTQIAIVGVVNSANAGVFNTINLTDSTGNPLNFTALSGNSGNGLTNLSPGSVVTFLLTIPAGVTSYQFYGQTMKDGTVVNTGTNSNLIGLANQNNGILQVQPTYFTLKNGYESQVITYTNIGNSPISSLSISQESPLNKLSGTCAGTLGVGASCQYTVNFDSTQPLSGDAYVQASYNNGSQDLVEVSTAEYIGTKTTGISVIPQGGQDFTFVTSTTSQLSSKQITLANLGNVIESNFVFTLPSGFSLDVGSTNNPCTLSGGNTVTNVLAPYNAANSSCDLTLKYTGPASITPQATVDMVIKYNANNTTITAPAIPLTTETIQASALLSFISPVVPYTFNTIRENAQDESTQVFVVKNIGDDSATNINGGLALREGGDIFTIISSSDPTQDCMGMSSLASNATCLVTVRFGPTGGGNTGPHSKNIQLFYTPYVGASQSVLETTVTGTIRAYNSAQVVVSGVTFTPAAQGGGIQSNPYQIPVNGSTTNVAVTFKNIGTDVASNFQISESNISNYTFVDSDCGSNLAINATCTVNYNVNSSTSGSKNINLNTNLFVAFTSDAGTQPSSATYYVNPLYPEQIWSDIYVNVYPEPVVTAVMSESSTGTPVITSVNAESSFYVVFTLSGGYNVGNKTYTVTAPAGFSSATGSCEVSSSSPSCYVEITAPSTASTGNTITVSGDPTPSPTSFTLDVTPLGPVPYAYIAATDSSSNSYIYRCVVGANAMPSNCQRQDNSFAGTGKVYQDVRFREFGASKYLYAVFNGGMRKCNLDSAGVITSCTNANGFSSTANYQYLNFGLVNGWTVAFVTAKDDGYGRPIIAVCYSNDDPNNFTGNPSGMSGNACKPSFLTPASLSPTGIAYINATGAGVNPNFYIYVNYAGSGTPARGKRYLFSTTGNDKVNVDSNVVDSNLNSSYPLIFDHYAQNAYSGGGVPNSTATQCKVNEATWVFDNCTNNPTLDSEDPTNYAKMAGRVALSSGSNYVYYSMKTGNTLYVCPISSNGTYSTNCTPTTSAIWGENTISTVYGIDFATY